MDEIAENLGRHPLRPVPESHFPDVGQVLSDLPTAERPAGAVDVLFVNPPAPDRGIWIRSQHRVGRRSRENMIWPQVSLAQLAALLYPDYSVEIIDAIPLRMTWAEFARLLAEKRPRYYVTQVAAPTLTNDMRGTFLARSLGARTIAFGTHVTPMPRQTLGAFPSLDYVLRGEPELTLREVIDTLDLADGRWPIAGGGWQEAGGRAPDPQLGSRLEKMYREIDAEWRSPFDRAQQLSAAGRQPSAIGPIMSAIKGLAWRDEAGDIRINADRPFIRSLDDLPLPLHRLLPWEHYRAPNIRGPYTFVVTGRGCQAGCRFCIKHVSYGSAVRVRSPESVLQELRLLWDMGLRNVHMYSDSFTASREQVMGICEGMIREGLHFKWLCNSRVDYVDPEMLRTMRQAGCWLIAWGIESASDEIRQRVHKGTTADKIARALQWSRAAGIMNWGYFIIGLPGETEDTIRQTIKLAKELPLDLALFHIAAPYPGTPFFFEVIENGWFRPGTAWEEVDMDESTVLDYPDLRAEEIERWARRAFREWALRPGPMWTFVRSLNSWQAVRLALNAAWQALGWMR
jgi:radical SAM superfamily enzyme YgiQ (UPF0313 family)